MATTIIYFTSITDQGKADIFLDLRLGTFFFLLIIFAALAIFTYKKVSTNYERIIAKKQLSDMEKSHEEQLKRHYKFRDELIAKNCKLENNNKILHNLIDHSDRKIIRIEKERDDMAYSFKRRGKKIRKMDAILVLKEPNLQLDKPNRCMTSIIKGYNFPEKF